MARCWTCGAHIEFPAYRCPACCTVEQIQNLRGEMAANLDELAEVQRCGFEELSNTLSEGLSEIASVIEWGFEEVNWQLQQQTVVLQSIDHTLKTPTQTQANEWRQMAEELRSRGVLDESEEFFRKSLDANPLDYRTYIGLAEAYLQTDRFDEAKTYLENSLPHAPDPDYKSYSYRLIGHVYACKDEYPDAVSALRSATDLSPTYYVALYDLAQYSAEMRDKGISLPALRNAIMGDSFYFYLAEKEKNFEPLSLEVGDLLKGIRTDASNRARAGISKAEEMIRAAEESIAGTQEALRKCPNKKKVQEVLAPSITALEYAKSKTELVGDKVALGDYRGFLDAIEIGKEAYGLAKEAKSGADRERKYYENTRPKRVKKALKTMPFAILQAVGGSAIIGGLVGAGIGAIIGALSSGISASGGGQTGAVLGALLGVVGGVIIGIGSSIEEMHRYFE